MMTGISRLGNASASGRGYASARLIDNSEKAAIAIVRRSKVMAGPFIRWSPYARGSIVSWPGHMPVSSLGPLTTGGAVSAGEALVPDCRSLQIGTGMLIARKSDRHALVDEMHSPLARMHRQATPNHGEHAILPTAFGGSKKTATAGCINRTIFATGVALFTPGSRRGKGI